MSREDYRGAAAALTLTNDLLAASTSFGVTGDTSGWPTGASGRPFGAVIDRGTAKEEKVLCSSLSASTITITSRGYDGTSAKDHSSGAAFEHYGPSASKMDDLDGHVYDTTRDDHSQYLPINGSRALTGVTALAGTPLSIGGTANLSGSALTFARSDHVHAIEAAGISDSSMFASNVIPPAAIPASTIDVTKFASGIRPGFVVADATALALLSPTEGDVAWVRDTKVQIIYNGTVWEIIGGVNVYQAAATGGPTSGSTALTLATITIPAMPATYRVELCGYWVPTNSAVGDVFDLTATVDGVTKATSRVTFDGATSLRRPFSIPTSTLTTISVNTATTLRLQATRTGGSGTLTEVLAGVFTAKMLFA